MRQIIIFFTLIVPIALFSQSKETLTDIGECSIEICPKCYFANTYAEDLLNIEHCEKIVLHYKCDGDLSFVKRPGTSDSICLVQSGKRYIDIYYMDNLSEVTYHMLEEIFYKHNTSFNPGANIKMKLKGGAIICLYKDKSSIRIYFENFCATDSKIFENTLKKDPNINSFFIVQCGGQGVKIK